MSLRLCSDLECDTEAFARGMCNKHYKRWRKSGGRTRAPVVHGEYNSVEYCLWRNMVRVGVCPTWKEFPAFLADMDRRPIGYRFLLRRDTSVPFSVDNCYWSRTRKHSPVARIRMSEAKRSRIEVDGEVRFMCAGPCGMHLPKSEFYSLFGNINGIRTMCKMCHAGEVERTTDPEKKREARTRCEARRRARVGGQVIPLHHEQFMLRRWGKRCLRCGARRNLSWDHLKPLALLGPHSLRNLQRLCVPCNSSKGVREVDYRSEEQVKWAESVEMAA
jgi:5-methylcytosine-specific restriction endonuclease McrA